MKMTCSLLVVALLLLSPRVRAQDSPGGSRTPDAAASKVQGADVLWYGKAPPGWGGVVGRMKLLAPGVGWAERGGRLYWTADNGANWKDITPPGGGVMESIFFLDSSKGWIAINHDEPPSEPTKFELVSTTVAGATWSRTTIPSLPKDYGFSIPEGFSLSGSVGTVTCVDPLHGWMNVFFAGETMNSWDSFLLLTSDGAELGSGQPVLRNCGTLKCFLLLPAKDGCMASICMAARVSMSPETERVAGRKSRQKSTVRTKA